MGSLLVDERDQLFILHEMLEIEQLCNSPLFAEHSRELFDMVLNEAQRFAASEFIRVTGKEIPLNIDGIMACVLNKMGFDPLEMAGISAVSYMCSIIAHVVEEIKEGVPLRIIPPEHGVIYKGPDERHIKRQNK
jgi:citrate synthase